MTVTAATRPAPFREFGVPWWRIAAVRFLTGAADRVVRPVEGGPSPCCPGEFLGSHPSDPEVLFCTRDGRVYNLPGTGRPGIRQFLAERLRPTRWTCSTPGCGAINPEITGTCLRCGQ